MGGAFRVLIAASCTKPAMQNPQPCLQDSLTPKLLAGQSGRLMRFVVESGVQAASLGAFRVGSDPFWGVQVGAPVVIPDFRWWSYNLQR